jgi:hypothetical protein
VKRAFLLAVVILVPVAASMAQDTIRFDAKPGLWESTTTMQISGMPAMPAMPQLTPEQLAQMPEAARKQLQAAMAGRAGGSPRTTTAKACITREMIDKGVAFNGNNQANCSQKVVSTSASKMVVHVECSPDQNAMNMKVVGDMTVERQDAEHVKMNGTVAASSGPGGPQGRTMETKLEVTSKWLGADCGDVKPLGDK